MELERRKGVDGRIKAGWRGPGQRHTRHLEECHSINYRQSEAGDRGDAMCIHYSVTTVHVRVEASAYFREDHIILIAVLFLR